MADIPPPKGAIPPELRFLKFLVTALAAVMIVGVVVIVGLLVIRLGPAPQPPELSLPDSIALPEGARPAAFTQGTNWIAVVTTEDEILIFDRSGQHLRQRIRLED